MYKKLTSISAFVSAVDNNGNVAKTELEITITDANDNSPKFTEPVNSLDLIEGQPIGTHIFTASANDEDIELNGQIKYRIIGSEPIRAKYLFDIEEDTGRVIIKQEVKRQEFST